MREEYDIAIAGGGLAGLSSAILLARSGHSVLLVEKESYPFHRVCGEYVGMESWNFLLQLGLPLKEMQLPRITRLLLTSPRGRSVEAKLDPGGFGISRFQLDHALAQLAIESGVQLLQATKVESITGTGPFTLNIQGKEGNKWSIQSRLCFAAWGKRSNMDLNWKRDFLLSASTRLENFVGIKYHVRTNWPAGTIALHNFENGYCGISRIEDGLTCLCYLTRAGNLKKSAGQIEQMEKNILAVNPHLKNILENAQPLPGFPVTISQISFSRKEQAQQGVLMLGDAAGMITPLCGNGMSIALRTGKMAATLAQDFFQGYLSRQQMEEKYQEEWQRNFSRRLWAGRKLQGFFGSSRRSNFFIGTIALFPFLSAPLVRLTHGQEF